ncbi:MAG: FUSC family protein, partial [Pseudomonas sp.]
MSALTLPFRWLASLEWRRGFFEWARTDGVTWVYIFKVLVAAFITLWLAMRLELPQPRTAMITVFIVMQPQSGHVFAKSFWRLLGTLAGSSMMVALIAIFPQNTELFLPSLAIWVGLCSAGAMRYRTFQAYGFVLAGYTAAMVGLPALQHPDGAFMAAVWRVLEISLGILVSTLVSAAILPQSAGAAMRNALYQRFGVFAGFVTEGLRGDSQRDCFESSNVRFIAEAVGLESLRNVTAFEDPHMRRRNGRLGRMNSEFMAITTRFNALHQLLERLRLRGPLQIVTAIEPGLNALAELLDGYAGRALTSPDAARLAGQLAAYKEGLPERVRSLRAAYVETGPTDADLLDFHTAYELLYRFVDDLHNYALTHASLADHNHAREQWDEPYVAQTNWMV